MTKLSPQAVNLLKRVQERITLSPHKYCQWHTCGTAYCVAGHLLDLFGIEHESGGVGEAGSKILGIDKKQEFELFYKMPDGTDGRFNPNHLVRSIAGVAHIQSFIDKYTVNEKDPK